MNNHKQRYECKRGAEPYCEAVDFTVRKDQSVLRPLCTYSKLPLFPS